MAHTAAVAAARSRQRTQAARVAVAIAHSQGVCVLLTRKVAVSFSRTWLTWSIDGPFGWNVENPITSQISHDPSSIDIFEKPRSV